MKSTLVGLIVIGILCSGCLQQEEPSESYTDVSPQEAKGLIDRNPDLVIIDVSPFYAQGHIPGAVNYYVGDGSLDDAILTLDKNKK